MGDGIYTFQSTLPTRGSDFCIFQRQHIAVDVSIHAPHEGERHSGRPCRPDPRVVSIHAPHEGERHEDSLEALTATNVSIHAPHEGERHRRSLTHMCAGEVSIHAPHEGERRKIIYLWWGFKPFQSTLPTRGSDDCSAGWGYAPSCFNPRSPRGGATAVTYTPQTLTVVSIHAPHEGERRIQICSECGEEHVSIHAPHEGERHLFTRQADRQDGFNPRSPRGGATIMARLYVDGIDVSIHAPHEGERPKPCAGRRCASAFQSTLPTRGSDSMLECGKREPQHVSIHAPHEGERQYW